MLKTVILGIFVFITLYFFSIPTSLSRSSSAASVETITTTSNEERISQREVSIGLPVRLKIPVIDVDSIVIPIGLTADGAMDIPQDPAEVAWYSLGPRPGEIGSAVIAGHLNWFQGQTGAFADLKQVEPGDIITVSDEDGVNITFVVREIRMYDAQADATDVFSSTDGKAHLNLITCDGVWDKDTSQYTERLVVFTDR